MYSAGTVTSVSTNKLFHLQRNHGRGVEQQVITLFSQPEFSVTFCERLPAL